MSLGSFLTGRSEIGEPYYAGLASPDPRFEEDLRAVDTYVRETARSRVGEFPKSLPLVEDYERWRQGLGWYDIYMIPNDTWNNARAKLGAINRSQESTLPPTTKVEEGSFIAPPIDTSKALLSPTVKLGLSIGAGIATVLLVVIGLSKLNPVSVTKQIAKGI